MTGLGWLSVPEEERYKGYCTHGHPRTPANTVIRPNNGHRYCLTCKRISEYSKKRQTNLKGRDKWEVLRKQVLQYLGGVCSRCGFSDWRALQLDHIDWKSKVKPSSIRVFYKQILRGEVTGLQVLCANCNWIKRYENKEARTLVYPY